ncbi:hypothetical protein [Paenibacillus sedimenti]|uniref:Uncharacterized protein n=1 Tax=Paenibacillus sedimenti TaxID=2770274 RepID=A0A926KUU1_9BACL|nr:hypothetical protein [Paenibacillus sedimenti]MBD0383566.1 hypothetical protein [Paenibacillus sedimenti]
MINAYPVTVINSYQTHKDYYRVSSVRSVTGGKSSTSRQPLDLPYDRLMYKQLAQRSAQGLAGIVQSAQSVKQSAQTLIESRQLNESITEPIRAFIHAYHTFQDQLRESPEYLIAELDDSSLEVQVDELKEQMESRDGLTNKSLGNIIGFAESLSSQLGRLEQLPTETLFQMHRSPLKPYGQYRSQLQAYLPVPMNGLLLDQRI